MSAMKRLLAICFICAFIFGCNSSKEKNTSYEVKAKVNQIDQVTSNLSIRVNSVEDSRCPEGCECVWAGEVKVFFSLINQGYSIDTSLVLPSKPRMQFKNFSIILESVSPYPICNYEFPNIFTIYLHVDDINKETLLVQGHL